jgi:uncharacterized protein (DUF2384 family)
MVSIDRNHTNVAADAARKAEVLSKAAVRAAAHLDLPNTVLARLLGLSEASISRLKNGRYDLPPGSKSYELAQLFVRLFRGIDSITGGDDQSSQSWMHSPNIALRGRPIDLIQTITGLTSAVAYVDSRRARI